MNRKLVATIAVLASTSTVFAQSSYIGVNLTQTDIDLGLFDVKSEALIFRLGKNLSDNFALETRWGSGINEDEIGDATFEVDYMIGAYGTYKFAPDATVSPYGLLGYTKSKLIGRNATTEVSVTDEGYSYGIGVDFKVSDNGNINLEYTKYLDQDDSDASGFSLGFNFSF